MVKRRKKTCPRCSRNLWLHEYYKGRNGYSVYCRDCTKELKREEYAKKRKPDGIYRDNYTGLLKEHKGYSTKIYWTDYMQERLRRQFPTTKNEDIATDLGVGVRTMIRKARELGLEKDKQWMLAHSRRNCSIMRVINKCIGNSGQFKKGQHASPATEFKKGQIRTER